MADWNGAEPLVSDPSFDEVEISVQKLRRYKLSFTDNSGLLS